MSRRSALRFATLVFELVVNGGLPAADFRPSGVAVGSAEVLVICRAFPASLAVSADWLVAVFGWPSTKLPPVAAMAVPDSATHSATNATTIAGDGSRRVKRAMIPLPW